MSLRTKWVKTEGRVVDVTRRVSRFFPGYSVVFSYRAGKHRYSARYTMLRSRGNGDLVSVEYDPENPKRVRAAIRQKVLGYMLPVILLLGVVWCIKHTRRLDAAGAGDAMTAPGPSAMPDE